MEIKWRRQTLFFLLKSETIFSNKLTIDGIALYAEYFVFASSHQLQSKEKIEHKKHLFLYIDGKLSKIGLPHELTNKIIMKNLIDIWTIANYQLKFLVEKNKD